MADSDKAKKKLINVGERPFVLKTRTTRPEINTRRRSGYFLCICWRKFGNLSHQHFFQLFTTETNIYTLALNLQQLSDSTESLYWTVV